VTLGLIVFDKGSVKINHHDLLSTHLTEWADQIGYVPQEGGLFPHLSAKENIVLVAQLRGWKKNRIQERLEELSQIVDLDLETLDRFPRALSGGQKQRVAIIRAAFMNPPVMLLDEPLGALDPLIRMTLQQELKSIFKRLKKTVVIVTHDLSEAVYLAEKITLLHEGHVVQSGTYEDLLLRPATPFVSLFVNAHRSLPELERSV
jgi:osmoprotectant transport system ATP-binding protein